MKRATLPHRCWAGRLARIAASLRVPAQRHRRASHPGTAGEPRLVVGPTPPDRRAPGGWWGEL